MHLEGIELYVKNDVGGVRHNLLHLIVHFLAVRALWIGKNDYLRFPARIPENQGIVDWYLRNVYPVELLVQLPRYVLAASGADDASRDDIGFGKIDVQRVVAPIFLDFSNPKAGDLCVIYAVYPVNILLQQLFRLALVEAVAVPTGPPRGPRRVLRLSFPPRLCETLGSICRESWHAA